MLNIPAFLSILNLIENCHFSLNLLILKFKMLFNKIVLYRRWKKINPSLNFVHLKFCKMYQNLNIFFTVLQDTKLAIQIPNPGSIKWNGFGQWIIQYTLIPRLYCINLKSNNILDKVDTRHHSIHLLIN